MSKKLFSKKKVTPIKVEQPLPTLEEIPVKSFKTGSVYDALIKESNKLLEQANVSNNEIKLLVDNRLDLLKEHLADDG